MPEAFVPLAAWLKRPPPGLPEPPAPPAAIEDETTAPDELCARVRRLRAAIIEALDDGTPDGAALERIRRYADDLIDRWSP